MTDRAPPTGSPSITDHHVDVDCDVLNLLGAELFSVGWHVVGDIG